MPGTRRGRQHLGLATHRLGRSRASGDRRRSHPDHGRPQCRAGRPAEPVPPTRKPSDPTAVEIMSQEPSAPPPGQAAPGPLARFVPIVGWLPRYPWSQLALRRHRRGHHLGLADPGDDRLRRPGRAVPPGRLVHPAGLPRAVCHLRHQPATGSGRHLRFGGAGLLRRHRPAPQGRPPVHGDRLGVHRDHRADVRGRRPVDGWGSSPPSCPDR